VKKVVVAYFTEFVWMDCGKPQKTCYNSQSPGQEMNPKLPYCGAGMLITSLLCSVHISGCWVL